MKRMLVTLVACLGLVAGPAVSGVFTVTAPGPLDSFSIIFNIANDDGFDLLSVRFDTLGTVSLGDGTPLVFGGIVGTPTDPPGGTSAVVGALGGTLFGFDFTGFNSGESFSFGWDPDIASNDGYGAIVAELVGTVVSLTTTGGTVMGVLAINDTRDGLIAVIASPVPEPASLALVALGILALTALRRRTSS